MKNFTESFMNEKTLFSLVQKVNYYLEEVQKNDIIRKFLSLASR